MIISLDCVAVRTSGLGPPACSVGRPLIISPPTTHLIAAYNSPIAKRFLFGCNVATTGLQ